MLFRERFAPLEPETAERPRRPTVRQRKHVFQQLRHVQHLETVPPISPAFHHLYNDNARLHLKWNEFLKLFVKSPAQMRDLNTAAPGFFHQVQELWWDDMLLHIFE
jgi:hypothetical protein